MRIIKETDYKTINKNFHSVRERLPFGVKIMCVLKADAYGHGLIKTAENLCEADYFGVASLGEALELRGAGILKPVLILGYCGKNEFIAAAEYDISISVFETESLVLAEKIAFKKNRKIKFHLQLDTGMFRLGLRTAEELDKFLNVLDNCGNLIFEGVYSHFCGSRTGENFEDVQYGRFSEFTEIIEKRKYNPVKHIASTSQIQCAKYNADMVRLGIGLYGYNLEHVEPALKIAGKIIRLADIKQGETVGYGRKFKAAGNMKIATVSIGYADGVSRALNKYGYVLVHGKRCKITGNICMDILMTDVTDVKCKIGDFAVILGKSGREEITAEEIAGFTDTICYEVLTKFSGAPRN